MRKAATAIGMAVLVVIILRASDFPVSEKEEIRKTLVFADARAPKSLAVDNVFGSIEVVGGNGDAVEMLVTKTIRAESREKLLQAKEEVTLDISQEEGSCILYVDGPFRCGDDGRSSRWKSRKTRRSRDPGYRVQYDFRLRVPRRIDLDLRTVTEGTIKVENVEGSFDVRNVNGPVEMSGLAGSGDARTVNGRVRVFFSRLPAADCEFKTINGKLEIYFPDGLKADFRLKTFNGEIYSDFPVTYLPALPPVQERRDGKFVYKSNRFFGVQVGGKGGPEIKLDTFNGDIFINKNKA